MNRYLRTSALLLLVLSVSLCLCGSSPAALDPEARTPYRVQVVVKFAEHRQLTPVFRDKTLRELREGLLAALGAMGQVEVIDLGTVPADRRPPLWQEVESKGLQAGLDGRARGASDLKTHFLFIDYTEGQYEVQARQYDGLTGMASATVRRERTPDREFVARTAALLVDRDFGLVGTIVEAPAPDRARVVFKGGQLGVPLDRWVKKDDVFALSQVSGGRPGEVRFTLLQVTNAPDDQGSCLCKVYQPRARALNDGDYRCLKLGTERGPLRLRLLTDSPRVTPSQLYVIARHGDFTESRATDVPQGNPDPDGYFFTQKRKNGLFDQIAFVTVRSGTQVRAQVPIAIIGDRVTTVLVRIDGDSFSQAAIRRGLWEIDLLRELLAQAELFKELNTLLKPATRPQALERAQKALDQIEKNIEGYEKEQKELQAEVAKGARLDLSRGNAQLEEVRKGRDELKGFLVALEKIIKEENDPARQEAKTAFEQARISEEREADYAKAIELYEKVLANQDDPKLRERLGRLKEAWKPKNEKHRDARDFIYITWPQEKEARVMKERIDQARQAFIVCKDIKDPLGPRRLVKVATAHAGRLAKELEGLSPNVNEDDVAPAKELVEVLDKLALLIKDVNAYISVTPLP